nr:unnamed protein product [Digitaria exilis]
MGTTYKCCLIFKRRFHSRDAPPPDDVRALFSLHSGGGPQMGADGLRRYLHATGHEDALDDAEVDRLLDQIRLQQQPGRARLPRLARPLLTLDDFHRYLFSHDLNPPIRHPQVHHDMTRPLSHYFIYTGHNSYLTGNQLSSDCSDVPIIKALQRGVRVIELDMWPNSAKDDINILHGRTLTTPVSLIKCLRSIKEYAFVASSYPVIITLEDHLPADLQEKVAKMVLEVFGDILYYPDTDHLKEFPSPETLRGRVLLSTKPPKEYLEANAVGTMKEGDADIHLGKGAGDDAAWGKEGYGRALWLMHGFYKANGGCGYVKKPDFLMRTEPLVFDPREPQPVKKTLKVKVGIAGVPADSVMKKTKAIEDNWVPVWEEEFSFPLTVPEIALLRVEVHEYDMSEKDDFGGQTVLPVSELRPGIRAVALFDRKGNKYNHVKLLMRFEFV